MKTLGMMGNTGPTTNIKRGPLCTLFPGKVLDFTTLRGNYDNSDPYSGFSICGYTGDVPQHYGKCLHQLTDALNVDINNIIQPRQTHGSQVVMLNDNFFSMDLDERSKLLDGVDGLITSCKRVVVGVNTADCVPVLLCACGQASMVAAVHAGWRGTLAGIAAKAARMMLETCRAEDIAAYIGVSICCDCFEVGDEVADAFFTAGYTEMHHNTITGKAHINLQEINRRQLVDCDIAPEKIFIDGRCSRHDKSGNYFSARRMGIHSGRTFTGIMLETV